MTIYNPPGVPVIWTECSRIINEVYDHFHDGLLSDAGRVAPWSVYVDEGAEIWEGWDDVKWPPFCEGSWIGWFKMTVECTSKFGDGWFLGHKKMTTMKTRVGWCEHPKKMWSISLFRPVYLNVFECIWIDSSEAFHCAAPGMVRCFHGPVAPCFWCLAISSAKFLGFRIPDSGPGMGNPRKPVGISLRGCYPPVIYG